MSQRDSLDQNQVSPWKRWVQSSIFHGDLKILASPRTIGVPQDNCEKKNTDNRTYESDWVLVSDQFWSSTSFDHICFKMFFA